MHIDRTVLITLSIALVVLNCLNAELEGLHNLETSVIDATKVDKVGGGLVEKVQNNKSIDSGNNSKVFGLKLDETGDNNTETKETVANAGDSTDKAKEGVTGKLEKGTLEPDRKVGLRGEECGSSSNSCKIEDKALVACLRVPGNESPDLSLLIQNKGKGMATVTISAPEFVHVETNEIEVPMNDNKKMKVSIRNKGRTDTVMVLKSGNGNCTLDFKDLISQETFRNHDVSASRFALFSNVLFLIVAAFLIIALLAIFIGLSRKRSEFLPVSNGGAGAKRKTIIESKNDGWADNWSDNWDDDDDDDDDEEAMKTSFLNVNSSFSQDVVSSRRINKDGWKD